MGTGKPSGVPRPVVNSSTVAPDATSAVEEIPSLPGDSSKARPPGATGFGRVGAVAKLSDMFSVGVRYMHSADVDYDGDAVFEQVPTGLELGPGNPLGLPGGTPMDAVVASQFTGEGALVDQGLATTLTLPRQLDSRYVRKGLGDHVGDGYPWAHRVTATAARERCDRSGERSLGPRSPGLPSSIGIGARSPTEAGMSSLPASLHHQGQNRHG